MVFHRVQKSDDRGQISRLSSLSNDAAVTSSSSSFVVVLVLVPYKVLIHEDEHEVDDEKNQFRSQAYALRLFLFSAFRIPTSRWGVGAPMGRRPNS
jgi:hypothetical protein